MKLRIAGTVNDSVVDGDGYRYTIFTQGCPHHCRGCQTRRPGTRREARTRTPRN